MTPLDRWPALTPLGPAKVYGVLEDGVAVEWLTVIDATRELWFFRNPHVRFLSDVTEGGCEPSPFSHISKALQKQIDRYKQNGWLL